MIGNNDVAVLLGCLASRGGIRPLGGVIVGLGDKRFASLYDQGHVAHRGHTHMESTGLAAALFEGLATCDDGAVRELCARDFRASQNGGAAMDLETLLGFNAAVHLAVRDFRYENAVRSATETGFVEQHAVRGTLADGSRLELQVCVVAEVSEGKITVLREYLDTKAAEGLIRALSGG